MECTKSNKSASYYQLHKAKFREYYKENREKKLLYQREYNDKKKSELLQNEKKENKKKDDATITIKYGKFIVYFN